MRSKKRKRKRQVASYQDYVELEGAWQGYMQQLLGVRTEEEEEQEKEEGREGEGTDKNDKPEPRSSNVKPAFSSKKSAERNVAGADMHGARVRVVASKSPSEVGLEGIVIRESRGAFHILPISDTLGKRRRVKIVPKAGRRFQATVEGGRGRAGGREGKKKKLMLILHGNGLVDRGRAIASALMMRRDKAGVGGEAGRLLKTTHLVP
jgi:RNase P/RNase MRP subunit p29